MQLLLSEESPRHSPLATSTSLPQRHTTRLRFAPLFACTPLRLRSFRFIPVPRVSSHSSSFQCECHRSLRSVHRIASHRIGRGAPASRSFSVLADLIHSSSFGIRAMPPDICAVLYYICNWYSRRVRAVLKKPSALQY